MPIKTLFFVYLFWIKFCLSERLRDCTFVHSLSLIFYLVLPQPQNKSGLSGLRTESPKKNEEQTLQYNVCEIKLKKN